MDKQSDAVNLIVRLEGIRLNAYKDSAGIATIGVGCTVYDDGSAVKIGDKCTIEQAQTWLLFHLKKYVFPLLSTFTVPDNVYVALSSFVYNVGHVGQSMIHPIMFQDWEALADAFKLYIYVDDIISPGLVARRNTEVKYFLG
jgi:lysozyme